MVADYRQILAEFQEWSGSRSDILGAALVGSRARGTARADSDLDIVMVAKDPSVWLENDAWLKSFGPYDAIRDKHYGLVHSRHVRYQRGEEVEFSITTDRWLWTQPVDDGSREVLSKGYRILDDKAGLFALFIDALRKAGPDEPVQIIPYDPSWPDRYEAEKSVLLEALGERIHGGIHHVGSTAVPGLSAKPVIDIMAGVRNLDEVRSCLPLLDRIGYCFFPCRDFMLWFCKPFPHRRSHHLYLMERDQPEWRDRIAFRDYLRGHPEARAEYTALKTSLARTLTSDREAYTEAKTEFVRSILQKAVKEARPEDP